MNLFQSTDNDIFKKGLWAYITVLSFIAIPLAIFFNYKGGKYLQWFFEEGEYELIKETIVLPDLVYFALGVVGALGILMVKDMLMTYFRRGKGE